MILFDSNYLKIEFKNVPCRHLVARWNGAPGDDAYKRGCATILQCCNENDIRKLLSDIRFQEQTTDSTKTFAERATSNFAARHGCLFHAVVLSNEVFLEFSVVDFDRSFIGKNYVQQFFSNPQDAVNWLQEAN